MDPLFSIELMDPEFVSAVAMAEPPMTAEVLL